MTLFSNTFDTIMIIIIIAIVIVIIIRMCFKTCPCKTKQGLDEDESTILLSEVDANIVNSRSGNFSEV